MSVSLLANAKINPTLRVLGRRGDGFHELVTTMLALDLGDVVSVSPFDGGGIKTTLRGPLASRDIPTDGTNLAALGARLGQEAANSTAGLSVDVLKNIPSRAGLGGGSADAAAAARGAAIGLGAGEACLGDRLAELGSDCAFFEAARHTGAALATGRGEEILPLEGPRDWWVALLTPEVECSTPAVYSALDAGPVDTSTGWRAQAEADAKALFRLSALDARAALVNDLEPAARLASPALGAWFTLLEAEAEAQFRLAGSGSSFFGLFADQASAQETLARLESRAKSEGLGVRLVAVTRPSGAALTAERGQGLG